MTLGDDGEELPAVVVIADNPLPGVPATRQVIDRVRKFEAEGAGHAETLPRRDM